MVALTGALTGTLAGTLAGALTGTLAGALAGAVIQPVRWPQTTAAVRTGFVVVMGVLIAVLGVVAAGVLATDIGRY